MAEKAAKISKGARKSNSRGARPQRSGRSGQGTVRAQRKKTDAQKVPTKTARPRTGAHESEMGMPGIFAEERRLGHSLVQASLRVGAANDHHEQEANRVAEQVVSGPASGAVSARAPLSIARVTTGAPSGSFPAPARVEHSLRGMRHGGSRLPMGERRFFESRMGYDFSNVRVHTGPQAEQSADAIQAKAFTTGNDIVFGKGQYQPGTTEGRRLLAHELTHTVQQRGGRRIQRQPQAKKTETFNHAIVLRDGSVIDFVNIHTQHVNKIFYRTASGKEHELSKKKIKQLIFDQPRFGVNFLKISHKKMGLRNGRPLRMVDFRDPSVIGMNAPEFRIDTSVSSSGRESAISNWDLGFIQNVTKHQTKLLYRLEKGHGSMRPLPALDSDKFATPPWTKNLEVVGARMGAVTLSTHDTPWSAISYVRAPGLANPVQRYNRRTELITWLVARQRQTRQIRFLRHVRWMVAFDSDIVIQNGTFKGSKSFFKTYTNILSTGPGEGSSGPVLKPPLANDSVVTVWKPRK